MAANSGDGGCVAGREGIDALVFTGGIGENSSPLRALICDLLRWLGALITADGDFSDGSELTSADATVRTFGQTFLGRGGDADKRRPPIRRPGLPGSQADGSDGSPAPIPNKSDRWDNDPAIAVLGLSARLTRHILHAESSGQASNP